MDNGFQIGCNYWASHAGSSMWSNWEPETIDEDFRALVENGIRVLRVFPLWPDFQPINALYEGAGKLREIRFGEEPLPDGETGQSGVSEIMLERFAEFTFLTKKHGLRLIIGLITGWMSGRLFVPRALEGRDILTDPLSVKYQVRFVRCFVKRFKNDNQIIAWDLGNECNVMQNISDRDSAWVWTSAISDAIRSIDAERPIISGMHSLTADGIWTIEDQAENTDMLTTHPYPIFTPYCDQDPVNTIRPLLHSACESAYYQGIGGKPCLVEEIGTIGPMIANEKIAADFVRVTLFSTWANGFPGYLWWCANDQTHLTQAPYDWCGCERELGLLRTDRSPKPILDEINRFSRFIEGSGLKELPKKTTEAVCIVSEGQDQWAAAYSSYILAKRAGFDIDFQTSRQPLKEAGLYLLPSIAGDKAISRQRFAELMDRVKLGATLYLSTDGGILSPFEAATGVRVTTRERRKSPSLLTLNPEDGPINLSFSCDFKLALEAVTASVIAAESGGNPILTRVSYGKGMVFFLGFPLETMLARMPGAFHSRDAEPYEAIYRMLNKPARIVRSGNPYICVTEHALLENERLTVLINYSSDAQNAALNLESDWSVKTVLYGSEPNNGLIVLPNCGVGVWSLEKAH